jgi:hypothetical protein
LLLDLDSDEVEGGFDPGVDRFRQIDGPGAYEKPLTPRRRDRPATAPIAEEYFGYVIKAGVRLLFFYLVLGTGVKIATQWNSAPACAPATTTLPGFRA